MNIPANYTGIPPLDEPGEDQRTISEALYKNNYNAIRVRILQAFPCAQAYSAIIDPGCSLGVYPQNNGY